MQMSAARALIERSAMEAAEIRLDVRGASQGKLRLGLSVTAVTIATAATGWPPGDLLQRALFLVLFALPSASIGAGIFVGELLQARAERRGELRADDREVRALRARIALDVQGPLLTVGDGATCAEESAVSVGPSTPTTERPPPRLGRRLVGGRQARVPFRSGYLSLR